MVIFTYIMICKLQRVSSNEKTGFHSKVSMKELPGLVKPESLSQSASGIKILWWVKVTVPTKTLHMQDFSGHHNFHPTSLDIALLGTWLFN